MASNNEGPAEPEPEVVEIDSLAIAKISRDEIEIQIATAKKFPRFTRQRGIEQFQREVLALMTADEETAAKCFYRLKRRAEDGRSRIIEGPSIRAAEIAASCWRNIHVAGRGGVVEQDFVVGQAVAWDLETNYRVGMETRRRITTRYGQRYGDDMIVTTANAAIAIAMRNAVFKLIPQALLKRPLEEAKKTSIGKGLTLEARRERVLKKLLDVGATLPEILELLERKSERDITLDDCVDLNGIHTAISDRMGTWATIMQDWHQQRPKSDEDIAKDLKGPLDGVDLAADAGAKTTDNAGRDANGGGRDAGS